MKLQPPARLAPDVAPNLVPLIDVMFLLMLFFLLGADMSQRESAALALPLADQARVEDEDRGPTAITSVRHVDLAPCAVHDARGVCRDPQHWVCSMRGLDYALDELGRQLAAEAAEHSEPRGAGGEGPPLSSKRLLVRADRAAPYGNVQLVLEAAARAGLYRVEVAALRPEPDQCP